jgi:hypothetical protein
MIKMVSTAYENTRIAEVSAMSVNDSGCVLSTCSSSRCGKIIGLSKAAVTSGMDQINSKREMSPQPPTPPHTAASVAQRTSISPNCGPYHFLASFLTKSSNDHKLGLRSR